MAFSSAEVPDSFPLPSLRHGAADQAEATIELLRSWLDEDPAYDRVTLDLLQQSFKEEPLSLSRNDDHADSTPLSLLAHPAAQPPIVEWAARLLGAGHRLVIPEIVDCEVRRKLLHLKRSASVRRLDLLAQRYDYLALDTATMQRAAAFWAMLRATGQTTADPKALDGDVILAAQTQRLIDAGHSTIVATSNVEHLARLVAAQVWEAL